MPLIVTKPKVPSPEAVPGVIDTSKFDSSASLEMVGRNCTLEPYTQVEVPNFLIKNTFIAYASPDSTYAVTRRLLDEAREEIIIGIYDFSAAYIKEIVLNAMQRGVEVSLMLDIDSPGEQALFDELAEFGCKAVPAPSCASKHISYFPSSHEKVIVIDGKWTLVQSGNYSKNSIPFNETDGGDPHNFVKGNRDMGVAILSKPLAGFFKQMLQSDMKLELDAQGIESVQDQLIVSIPDLVELVPELLPDTLFPSKTFKPDEKIKVTPVLTPDNYMDVIPELLYAAKKSIYIENQYIRSSQSEVAKLLEAIKAAKDNNPRLDVRIILGKLFGAEDVAKEKRNIANMKAEYGLVLDENIRYIDTKRFVHCHNKLIIVDGESVVISSQNWSNTGVSSNREAGLLIHYPELAKYYSKIFVSDWDTAQKKIPTVGKKEITPESVAKGNYVKVVAADYQEI